MTFYSRPRRTPDRVPMWVRVLLCAGLVVVASYGPSICLAVAA